MKGKKIKLTRKLFKKTNEVARSGEYIGNGAFMVHQDSTNIGAFLMDEEDAQIIDPEMSWINIDKAKADSFLESVHAIPCDPDQEWIATDRCYCARGSKFIARIFLKFGTTEEAMIDEEYVRALGLDEDSLYSENGNGMFRSHDGLIIVMPYRA